MVPHASYRIIRTPTHNTIVTLNCFRRYPSGEEVSAKRSQRTTSSRSRIRGEEDENREGKEFSLITTVDESVERSRRETADLGGRTARRPRRRGAVPAIVTARKRLLPVTARKQSRERVAGRKGFVPPRPRLGFFAVSAVPSRDPRHSKSRNYR